MNEQRHREKGRGMGGSTLVTTAPRNENFSFYVISVRFFLALPPSLPLPLSPSLLLLLLLLLRFCVFLFSLLCFAHFSITFEFLSECRVLNIDADCAAAVAVAVLAAAAATAASFTSLLLTPFYAPGGLQCFLAFPFSIFSR